MNPDVEALAEDLMECDLQVPEGDLLTETRARAIAEILIWRGWTKLSDLGDDN